MIFVKSGPLGALLALGISLLLIVSACKTTSKPKSTRVEREENPDLTIFDRVTKSEDIAGLVAELSGSFSAQGMTQDSVAYDMSMHVTPIWLSKADKYLYVEQGPTATPDMPLRQRIYKVSKDNEGGFVIKVYLLNDPQQYIGKWKEPEYFYNLDESIMAAEEGCALYLIQHADGSFSGSTRMDHCKNEEEGAAYLTTTIKIRKENILIWDQGFDTEKNQVWGLKLLGYRYVRK